MDDYFGEMKLVNHIVDLNDRTIEEMVLINMKIIDKYHLFSKEKIVFMLWFKANSKTDNTDYPLLSSS
ncbi:MAG: hypothetical protein EOM50_09880 [Erysipelotrichia bacterium]|nr:hypothetical protein [Erysipelotrichia bacterium]